MRDRIPTEVLDNGAVRYAVYDESGKFQRYEYMLAADEPADGGTPLSKGTILTDDVEALIWGAAADRMPNDAFAKMSEFYQHWWSAVNTAGITTYICSPNRNAYPDSGTVDGLAYKYLGVPFENAREGAKIAFGSYKGTNVYGSSNKNTLTFSFVPKAVYLNIRTDQNYSLNYGKIWLFNGSTKATRLKAYNDIVSLTVAWSGNSVTYYATSSATDQMNGSYTYDYLAIG